VLKESNSDYMMNIYYMTLKVAGDPIEEDDSIPEIKKIQISMELIDIDVNSKGMLKFSHPIQMENVVNNFKSIFHVYIKTVMKEIEELEDFTIDSFNTTTNSFNFTCTFKQPYLLGLLNKKSDFLTFEIRNDSNSPTEMLLLNITGEEMASNMTQKRIEMQFDFRSKFLLSV
jgi:hypothetical protein